MASSLPYALDRAYTLVVYALNSAIEEFKRTRSISNAMPVRDAIERFLYEIELNEDWYAELVRRSEFVQTICGAEDYAAARHRALANPIVPGESRPFEKNAIRHLSNPFTQNPIFLSEVVGIRESIENLFRDGFLTVKSKAGADFDEWRDICIDVQRKGDRLDVDGCWYLLQFNYAIPLDAPFHVQVARGLSESTLGTSNLESILAAARSMAAWIGELGQSRPQGSLNSAPGNSSDTAKVLAVDQDSATGLSAAEVTPSELRSANRGEPLRPFMGGEMVFMSDRIELCGANICSGDGAANHRAVLEALAAKHPKGNFIAIGAKKLAKLLVGHSEGNLPGLVRNIRVRIANGLKAVGIRCGMEDVIGRTRAGYQLSRHISVQAAPEGQLPHKGWAKSRKSPADAHRDDTNDTNAPNLDEPNGTDKAARAEWILQQLLLGRPVRACDVARKCSCSLGTAKRDMQSLVKSGAIEFVGPRHTGYYQPKIS